MKRHISTFLAGTLTLFVLAGCKTTAPDRSARAADSIAATHDSLQTVRDQITSTLASLDALMAADDTGLRSAYDQYAKDVKSLQAACDSVNKRAKDMRAKKADYLQAWTKDKAEVQNEELRLIAKERKAETTAAFERVRTELDRASTAFVPFMSNLNDIQKVIGNDLTPEGRGLVAQTAVVANANDHGNAVVAIMDSALEELKKVAARVSPTGVAPTS